MRLDTDGLPMRTPLFFLLVLALLQGLPARSTAAPAMLCDAAAQYAASKTGVPLSILRAVTLAETGRTSGADRQFAAWPWAIQSGNRGDWFSDADAALSHVKGLMAQGISNLDIGCFQLNLRWHGEAFGSLQDMISPQQNALYAAQFLQALYAETGDWRSAVGRYHSRDGMRAQAYVSRLETIFNTHVAAAPPQVAPQTYAIAEPERSLPRRFGLTTTRGPLIARDHKARPLIGGN